MVTAKIFMLAVALLVAVALPLAAYILVKERTANLHKIWNLAVAGNRLAKLYTAVVLIAFMLAVAGWLLAFADRRIAKEVRVGASIPGDTLQSTLFDVG